MVITVKFKTKILTIAVALAAVVMAALVFSEAVMGDTSADAEGSAVEYSRSEDAAEIMRNMTKAVSVADNGAPVARAAYELAETPPPAPMVERALAFVTTAPPTQEPTEALTPTATEQPSEQPAEQPTEQPMPEPTEKPASATAEPPTEPLAAPTEPAGALSEPQEPTSKPEPTEPLEIAGGVTIIGDSVCLGARSAINEIVPDSYMDAAVSRMIATGHDVLMEMQRQGTLREYVVIALGTNGDDRFEQHLTQIFEDLEPGHRLVVVIPYDGRTNNNAKWVNKTAAWERETLEAQYPYLTLADWNAVADANQDTLAGDLVHMGNRSSMDLYAQCLAEALRKASEKPMKE